MRNLEPGHWRVVVVGTTGAGKTTLARELSLLHDIPHVELDALHWDANWTPAPVEIFRERVSRAVCGPAWVVDGNYRQVRDIVWPQADTLIWLDYPLPFILMRLVRRTAYRIGGRIELWNGNRERLQEALFSRDSILWWALTTHLGRRRRFFEALALPEHAHLRVVRLRHPRRAGSFGLAPIDSPDWAALHTLPPGPKDSRRGW